MTTTPLPPDTHCFDDDTQMDVWSYSAPLVEQIVKQARADLEAEVARLREALLNLTNMAESFPTELHRDHPDVQAAIAALEGKP